MNADKLKRELAAGYTYRVEYEIWRPILGMWVHTGFPTTADALFQHEAACERRAKAGEIRNWHIHKIEVPA